MMIDALDGLERRVSFDGRLVSPWSDGLEFTVTLAGDVLAATLTSDGPRSRCVEGDSLFAEVEVGVYGQHFSGVGPGLLRWRGPDVDEDLWLRMDMAPVETQEWLADAGEQVVQDVGCEPFDGVGISALGSTESGTWGNQSLAVWAILAGGNCWSQMATATWLNEAPSLP
jgi:hypothetical protein